MLKYNGQTLYTLDEHPDYCHACHQTGGYCGQGCNGTYFDSIKPSGFMLVSIDKCAYCDKSDEPVRSYVITSDEYKRNLRAYKSGVHECTSSHTIFGGGACCNVIGHHVQPLYL